MAVISYDIDSLYPHVINIDMNKPNFFIANRTVILQNYRFWAENVDELDAWLKTTKKGTRNGMTLTGLKPKELTMFSLRWPL